MCGVGAPASDGRDCVVLEGAALCWSLHEDALSQSHQHFGVFPGSGQQPCVGSLPVWKCRAFAERGLGTDSLRGRVCREPLSPAVD